MSMFSSNTKSAMTSAFPSLQTDRALNRHIFSLSGLGVEGIVVLEE